MFYLKRVICIYKGNVFNASNNKTKIYIKKKKTLIEFNISKDNFVKLRKTPALQFVILLKY